LAFSKNTAEDIEVTEEHLSYAILEDTFEKQGRSAARMALDRRCARCWGNLYQMEPGEQAAITFEDHRTWIRDDCFNQSGYLSPDMPTLELAFRILIGAGVPEMPLAELHQRITEIKSMRSVTPHITPDVLRRMLDADHYYGVQRVDEG
jgi:hypothetical protein